MTDHETDQDRELDEAFAEFSGGKKEDAELSQHDDNAEEVEANIEEAETAEVESEKVDQGEEEAEQDEPDELAKYKQEAETWKHKYNSDLGRQNALQRKLQEQEEQLRKMQQFKSTEGKKPGVSEDEWNALKEDYPDIAGAFETRLNSLKSEHQQTIEAIKGEIAPMKEQAQQQYIESQRSRLDAAHNDWREIVQTPEYAAWLNSQPGAVQSLMGSQSADDNIYLLNTFKSTLHKPNNDSQQRRQKQLQQSQTIPNRSNRAKTNVISEDDFEGAFDYYANKKR